MPSARTKEKMQKAIHAFAHELDAVRFADILNLQAEERTFRFSRSAWAGAFRGKVSDVTFNRTIREIARACGIDGCMKLYRQGEFSSGPKWQYVSSHTARRTAATLLYLRCNNIYLVSRIMGHSSITQTETYVCCSLEDMPESVSDFFAKFK